MRFNVLFEPNAKLDIQDAISWYNQRSKGLGKKFILSSEQKLKDCAKILISRSGMTKFVVFPSEGFHL